MPRLLHHISARYRQVPLKTAFYTRSSRLWRLFLRAYSFLGAGCLQITLM